jgi:hypothetical protein
MTPATADLLTRTRQVAAECERFFRARVFEAELVSERGPAEAGLRHAVGLRKAVDHVLAQKSQPECM